MDEQYEMEIARENASMVSELEHINLEAVTKKDNTPKIVRTFVISNESVLKLTNTIAIAETQTPHEA